MNFGSQISPPMQNERLAGSFVQNAVGRILIG